jgi:hypothetical protein
LCYGRDSNLTLGTKGLVSSRGVQQGDPLGPMLFALAIQEAIIHAHVDVQEAHPGTLNIVAFYLDDGVVAGDTVAVKMFSEAFKRRVAEFGLSVSTGKCKVIPPAGEAASDQQVHFPGWQWAESGLKLLGFPLGSPAFCAETTQERVDKAKHLLKAVADMSHTQGALQLLRHCASWGKLVYAARTVPPEMHDQELVGYGEALRSCLP